MKLMRVLVVGAGYWGPNIVRNLVEFSEVEAIGVSDLDTARAEKLVKKYPRTHVAMPAPDAFRDGYDAAFIVTPVATHADLAAKAIEAGMHVYVEKPLTKTSEEARMLIELSERRGRTLMVGHVFHYKPCVRTLVNLVKSGELGNIKYLDSVRVNLGQFRSDVNVMWDLAPHDLSIFEAVLGKAPKRVSAIGECHVSSPNTFQETMMLLTLDYGDGCMGHVHVNWFSPLKQRLMVVAGDKKMAVYDDIHPIEPIRVYDRGTYNPSHDKDPFYVQLRSGDTHVPHIVSEEPLRVQLREFFQAIREKRPPETDGRAGFRVVATLEAAMQSLKEDGRYVPVNIGVGYSSPVTSYEAAQ
jgi:predicted dehydrogenase